MKRFEEKFRLLMSQAPIELQNQWDNLIQWNPILQTPIIPIASKLKGKLLDQYVVLKNQVEHRTI